SPLPRPPPATLFPYTTLFRSCRHNTSDPKNCQDRLKNPQNNRLKIPQLGRFHAPHQGTGSRRIFPPTLVCPRLLPDGRTRLSFLDRKSTRLNSSHVKISYAVF